MEEFIRASTMPFCDMFTYKKTRLERKDGNSLRLGPRLVEDFEHVKRLNDLKPGRITPEDDPEMQDGSPNHTLIRYLYELSDNLTIREIDLDFIRSLLSGGADVHVSDKYGQSMVHAFVRDWHHDTIRFAEELGFDLDVQDHFGVTPLHLAAAMNLKETTEELCLHGANPNIQTFTHKQTPMHFAAKYDATEAMRVLLRYECDIGVVDVMNRTPLFVAAEFGCPKAVQFLMDYGAPAGVSNSLGVPALTFIAEKMPDVAYNALSQFKMVDMPKKQVNWFINNLENYDNRGTKNIEKTALELIAIYGQFGLAAHPVVEKAISVKWRMYGRRDTWWKMLLTCCQLVLWMVLAYHFPDNHDYYTPLDKNGWKIAVEGVIILSWFYLFVEEMKKRRILNNDHNRWVACRKRNVSENLQYCHPTWLSERDYLIAEIDRVKFAPSLAKAGRVWFIYEQVYLVILVGVIATRIVDLYMRDTPEEIAALPPGEKITPLSKDLFLTHKMVFSLGMLTAFCRLFKFLVRFRTMGIFLRLSALSFESFIQFLLLFVQFYIPLTAAFWAMFGSSEDNIMLMAEAGASGIKVMNVTETLPGGGTKTYLTMADPDQKFHLTALSQIAFHLWELVANRSSALSDYLEFEPSIVRCLYILSSFLITFVGFNVFTALVVFTFQTKYAQCTSRAIISIATTMINYEKGCSPEELNRIKREHKEWCSPLVEPIYDNSLTSQGDKEMMIADIEESHRKMHWMHEQVRDAERRYLNAIYAKDSELMRRMRGRMEVLYDKQVGFKTQLHKDLADVVKKQENYNKALPKMLAKAARFWNN